ncbi:MAG: hypothetical protein BWY95_00807 [Bacteroidetes bacterium ADurb.BinA104]|nr:MAG: hypothetical protein BWY95_00807 [Bacteroidetes bacterium ADurb.BinA104]
MPNCFNPLVWPIRAFVIDVVDDSRFSPEPAAMSWASARSLVACVLSFVTASNLLYDESNSSSSIPVMMDCCSIVFAISFWYFSSPKFLYRFFDLVASLSCSRPSFTISFVRSETALTAFPPISATMKPAAAAAAAPRVLNPPAEVFADLSRLTNADWTFLIGPEALSSPTIETPSLCSTIFFLPCCYQLVNFFLSFFWIFPLTF